MAEPQQAAKVESSPAGGGAPALDPKVQQWIESVLSCVPPKGDAEAGKAALKKLGWNPDQASKPLVLPWPLSVHGFPTQKIIFDPEAMGAVAWFAAGVTSTDKVAKAAGFKVNKDGRRYYTKQGKILDIDKERGQVKTTCMVDAGGD